jgi:molecular chaperone GrpE
MSEPPPPTVAEDAAVRDHAALTPGQVDAVLADFRGWLAALPAAPDEAPADAESGPDLYTLLAQFTALRHEVNLQTKASRGQLEHSAATLSQLTRALDSLEQARAAAGNEREECVRPLLESLVELHDALSLAGREARRVQDTVLPALREAATGTGTDLPELPRARPPSRWARLLGARGTDLTAYAAAVAAWREREEERAGQRREGLERVRQLLASMTAGYTMSLQRVERALHEHGLEAIPAAGRPFDPERMEAVEAVTDSGRPAGQVLDEVQRGYLWKGRVFRFARVRVAKSWVRGGPGAE